MGLYHDYRPSTLEEVVGNASTVRSLQHMTEKGNLPHAILLYGPSGNGKTTLARIIRNLLGCHNVDQQELNSSNFRGIETVREIQRTMHLAPHAGPCRVWIIDECHQWTRDAQNAALKMLEDTPSHVYFILCTTDPQKLIKPIRTRCTELAVQPLVEKELVKVCKRVAKKEKIKISREHLEEIASESQGSARIALVLLERAASVSEEDRSKVIEEKMLEQQEAIELCRALISRKPWKTVAKILSNLKGDPEEIRWAVLGYARAVLLKSGNAQAYTVIEAFRDHFYDSKHAGLTAACFEAIEGD